MDKKLIYVLNHYSEKSSSHFFHILNLLKEISKTGVEVALVIEKCESEPPLIEGNVKVYPIKLTDRYKRVLSFITLLIKLHKKGFVKTFIRISTISTSTAILVSIFFKFEIFYWHSGAVLEQYNDAPFSFKKVKSFFKSRLPFNYVKKNVDYFVTGPESMKEYYIKVGMVSKDKIRILYNDISLERFKKASVAKKNALRKKYNIVNQGKLILFVHRFSPVRKTKFYIPYIFDQFFIESRNKDCTILLVGGGPEKKSLIKEIQQKKYSNNVRFMESIPNREIQELYQMSDIFINPTFAEGFPRVLLEAMACGLPIVTTDAGGICDVLGEKQKSYMVGKEDRISFVLKLLELINSETLINDLSNENVSRVRKFSTENVAKMYTNIIFYEKN